MARQTLQQIAEIQKKGAPPVVKTDLTGKTVMVTGANSGIGYEAAVHFATMSPARLILVCRTIEKAQESIKTLEAATGYKNAEPMALDLGRFSSISDFADQAQKSIDRLDILVENAAIYPGKEYSVTEDGWETMLQVNALGPALHTLLLLPALVNTAKQHSTPRIVVVSSDMIFFADVSSDAISSANCLQTLSSREHCVPSVMENRYSQTKILNVMFTNKLAELLPKTIVPVSLNPGFCLSGLRRSVSEEEQVGYKKMEDEFAFTSEEGSRQILYCAVGGTDEELRGKYVSYSKTIELPDWMLTAEAKKAEDKTWNEMIGLFGKLDARVPQIVSQYLS